MTTRTSLEKRGKPLKNIRGERFGKLVAKEFHSRVGHYTYWLCKCDCGTMTKVHLGNLGRSTFSCGCARVDACKRRERAKNHPTHGIVLTYYRKNAKTRSLPWCLSTIEFTTLLLGDCHYCGAKPKSRVLLKRTITFNGIDRVDNAVGYVARNCVSCCTLCNVAKGTRSIDEFKSWIRLLSNRLNNF